MINPYFPNAYDSIIIGEDPLIQGWAHHKKHRLIRAGLNQACSSIVPAIFHTLRKHTNAVEQTHYKSNSRGRQLPLLQAVIEYILITLQVFTIANNNQVNET